MTVFATEPRRLSNVLKHEYEPDTGFCRLVVTVNEATAKDYVAGTVLGKVTATGKYKISVQTAADGSQVPDAVVMGVQAIPASTDVKVLALVRGPVILSKFGLVLDSTFDNDVKKNAAYAALEAKGMLVNESV